MHTHTYTHTYIQVGIHTHTYIHTYVQVGIHTHTYIHTYIRVGIHTHIHTHIRTGWHCTTCFTPNKPTSEKCVACLSPRAQGSGGTPTTSQLAASNSDSGNNKSAEKMKELFGGKQGATQQGFAFSTSPSTPANPFMQTPAGFSGFAPKLEPSSPPKSPTGLFFGSQPQVVTTGQTQGLTGQTQGLTSGQNQGLTTGQNQVLGGELQGGGKKGVLSLGGEKASVGEKEASVDVKTGEEDEDVLLSLRAKMFRCVLYV
jgi:hypothetical protein